MKGFLKELNRRNVTRVALLYAGVSWLLIQIAETVLPIFDVSNSFLRLLIILLLVGLVAAIVLAWFYDVTPDGIKPDKSPLTAAHGDPSAQGLNLTIGVVLAVAVLAFVSNRAGWFGGAAGPKPITDASLASETANPTIGSPSTLVMGVAVLPFENLSEEQENAFFATGVHDEILTNLAAVQDFRVISRTSVRGYADTLLRIPEIAGQLGVSHVMEGSVRRSGDRVRVTVLLIDAINDRQIWSESYDRTLLDIFAIQSDIARQIVSNIQGELSPELYADIGARSTDDTAAYDLYLQARAGFLSDIRSSVILEEPLRLIREALEIDPSFVEAWVELVRICGGMVWWDQMEYTECATEALQQVRLLAPESPRRVVAEAMYAYRIERDYPRALELLLPVASDLPNDGALAKFIGYSARRTGRWDEAVAAMQQVILLDPRDESSHDDLMVTLAASGDWREAIRFGEEAAAKFPGNRLLPFLIADFRRQYEGDLSAYGPAMLALPPSLRSIYGNPWIAGVFPNHEARRRWVAEAVGSGTVGPLWATGVEVDHHRLNGQAAEAKALSGEIFRQFQLRMSDDWERESRFNLSALAMAAAGAGADPVARRLISVVQAMNAREDDQLMEDNRLFIVRAYLELGDLDGAWEELKLLMAMGLGPTVWDLRQDQLLQHYFAGYAPFETFVASRSR